MIEQTVVCGVWNGQRDLFLLDEFDPELGLAKPDDFACSRGLIFQYNLELRRNAGRGLKLGTRRSRRDSELCKEQDAFRGGPSRISTNACALAVAVCPTSASTEAAL